MAVTMLTDSDAIFLIHQLCHIFWSLGFTVECLIWFSIQRFGSGTMPTHVIGAALLKGEWKSAANMILDPREGDILSLCVYTISFIYLIAN